MSYARLLAIFCISIPTLIRDALCMSTRWLWLTRSTITMDGMFVWQILALELYCYGSYSGVYICTKYCLRIEPGTKYYYNRSTSSSVCLVHTSCFGQQCVRTPGELPYVVSFFFNFVTIGEIRCSPSPASSLLVLGGWRTSNVFCLVFANNNNSIVAHGCGQASVSATTTIYILF